MTIASTQYGTTLTRLSFPALLAVLAASAALQGSGAFAIRKLPIVDNFIPQLLKA